MHRGVPAWLLAVALAGGGCATSPATGRDAAAWLSDGPPLSDCFVGYMFADCGGDGPPRLGCDVDRSASRAGPCLWFTGGVVAARFVASACDASDPCCADVGNGGWPYVHGDPAAGDAFYFVADFLHAWGLEPWDRDREVRFAVEIAPALASRDTPELLIDGAPPATGAGLRVDVLVQDTVAIVVGGAGGLGLQDVLLIELVPTPGAYDARVCRHRTADGQLTHCDEDFHRGADCAVEADLQLSHVPVGGASEAPPALRLRAQLADGTQIELSL